MDVVDEIKQKLDIVDLIGDYVPLTKAGRNFKGLCPFHGEKTPSFVVFPETQGWHCFGACSTGGDIFTFVMRRENLDFKEALALLADKAGVELRPMDTTSLAEKDELDRLRAINTASAQFYHHLLMEADQGQPGRTYLERRGVTRETMATFQLGYAPTEWHALGAHLQREHWQQEDCLTAGVLSRNERGDVYDRFRGRVIFPIRDPQGQVIGFGGRTLGDDVPKYLNSPQTPLFDKGALLYGIDLAREHIRETGVAIMVEGYMDVIVPYQEGARGLVASMGTALTEEHFATLRRITKVLILALDPDAAGIRAVVRGAETAHEHLQHTVRPVVSADGLVRFESQLDAQIRVMTLPDGLDPDELILQDRALWDRLVAAALPVADFLLQLYASQVDLATAQGKRTLAENMLPVIAAMASAVEQTHYMQQLGQLVRVEEQVLRADLETLQRAARSGSRTASWARGSRRSETSSTAEPTPAAPKPDQAIGGFGLEERCLALLLRFPDLVPVAAALAPAAEGQSRAAPWLVDDDLQQAVNRQLYHMLVENASAASSGEHGLHTAALDSALHSHVESLLRGLAAEPALDRDAALVDLAKSAARLRKTRLLLLIRELRFMQQAAQAEEEGASLDAAASQMQQLNSSIEILTHKYLLVEQSYHAATLIGRSKREHAT